VPPSNRVGLDVRLASDGTLAPYPRDVRDGSSELSAGAGIGATRPIRSVHLTFDRVK